MFKLIRIITTLFFSLFIFCANAEEPNSKVCELDASNQPELNICANRRLNHADSEMNQLYTEQMHYLSTKSKKRLRDSQRAWVIYRDKACQYSSRPRQESGSIWPMENDLCLEELTLQRSKVLRNYIECRANGCPE
jgi:uncharacterized protein YecT (DUF1311 family)